MGNRRGNYGVHEMSETNKTEVYKNVLAIMEEHKDAFCNDYELDIRDLLKSKILVSEIANDFGINIMCLRLGYVSTYFKLNDYCSIGLWGEDHRRTISWSDDGSQPVNEWLYQISFPTGAYIFGEHYPTESFNAFFEELRTFAPKYSDSNNHNLYFTKDTAKNVHTAFNELMKKYRELAVAEYKKIQIRKLEEQLETLKG
jgi:hypothetical protein